ncbi:hypothetical protein SAMN05444287_0296 [Octadecabacter temperatus]|uniref:Uncharacterized protein n=1 Tax=Octadecabacter temperatus TaxID=1458307 RepID=A0A0K0Y2P3_9RHOB|nr:hypothetical protein OSB_06430 [Octadecabacter temperatus]SIN88227.1 hypothetical protein SAMN05444287_0296 [Octadecabacter temperatus]
MMPQTKGSIATDRCATPPRKDCGTKLHIYEATPMIYGAGNRGTISMEFCTPQPRWSRKLLLFLVRWE